MFPTQTPHNVEPELGYSTLDTTDCTAHGDRDTDWERGKRFQTKSGVRVRSKIEKIIADFLYEHGIRFHYEPVLTLNGDRFRPDFYLPDYGLFYEHFGIANDDAYCRRMTRKLATYQRHSVRFVYTTAGDESKIQDVLKGLLRKRGARL